MGIARSNELDEFLDDENEVGGEEFTGLSETERKARKTSANRANHASWRSVEDYLETKRLKKSLSEYYDLDD